MRPLVSRGPRQAGSSRGRAPRALAVRQLLAALVALSMLFVVPAVAGATPTLIGSFNGSDTPAESLGLWITPSVAVDESTGDVYVLDITRDLVNRFDSEGKYLGQILGESMTAKTFSFAAEGQYNGIAIDNSGGASQGDIYVWGDGSLVLFALNPDGSERWEASEGLMCGIAVDQSGNLWEGNSQRSGLAELDPSSGTPTGTVIPTTEDYCPLAFDNEGAAYTAASGEQKLSKFTSTGEPLLMDPAGRTFAVATSFRRNDIFSVSREPTEPHFPAIRQWDKSGAKLSEIDGVSRVDEYRGVAINGRLSRLYVANRPKGEVQIFSVPPQPPTVRPQAASGVTKSGATLAGSVNPNGSEVTDCHVAYETEAQFASDGGTFASAQSAPCSPAAPYGGTSDTPVSASLSGLAPGTTYDTEIVATNAGGATAGSDVIVTTLPQPPPAVVTGSASSVGETGATLGGTVNPEEGASTCVFQYGADTNYGSEAPCASSPGGDAEAVPVSAALAGLTPGKTYHFRLVATNAGGTSYGSDASFTTAQKPVLVEEKPVVKEEKPLEKPFEKPVEQPKAKKLTRGQLLAAAIKKCKKLPKHKRAACIKRAKKKYAPPKKHKKK